MTDDKISQLVQDVIDGKEDPRKALHIVQGFRNIHLDPDFIEYCLDKISELIDPEEEIKVHHKSQWVRIKGQADNGTSLERMSTDAQAYYRT